MGEPSAAFGVQGQRLKNAPRDQKIDGQAVFHGKAMTGMGGTPRKKKSGGHNVNRSRGKRTGAGIRRGRY